MAEGAGGALYPVDQLRPFTLCAFGTVGVPDEDAVIVADNLIEANLRGVDTHGITRPPSKAPSCRWPATRAPSSR